MSEETSQNASDIATRRYRDVLAAVGTFLMVAHAILGTLLFPLYLIQHRPHAPISVFFAFCSSRLGGIAFWTAYALLFIALFSWSFRHVLTNTSKHGKA